MQFADIKPMRNEDDQYARAERLGMQTGEFGLYYQRGDTDW
jgi:hypothetical protein